MGMLVNGPWSLTPDSNSFLTRPRREVEYVAFDVETTGLFKNDRIVEIAFVAFCDGKVLEEWSTLINPLRDVSKSNIHGITASMVSTAPLFEDVINDIFRINYRFTK